MVQCEITYAGGLRTLATHGPSGGTLVTDAPVDNRGQGKSFSPTDLLGVALSSCVLTLMGIAAEDMGQDLPSAKITVDKTMKATPMRHIGRLKVSVEVGGQWSDAEKAALESAARGCPVLASLGERVDVQMRFLWSQAS